MLIVSMVIWVTTERERNERIPDEPPYVVSKEATQKKAQQYETAHYLSLLSKSPSYNLSPLPPPVLRITL